MSIKSLIILTSGLAYGGAETQLVRLAISLKRRGWFIRIITMLEPEAFVDELTAHDISIDSMRMQRGKMNPQGLVQVVRLLRHYHPKVLVSFNFPANILGRVAGRLSGVPVIVSSIRSSSFGGARRDWVMRFTSGIDAATTTNSALVASSLVKRRVVTAERIRVTPNGLLDAQFADLEGQGQQIRRAFGVDDKTFVWLAAGRLETAKDYPTLLRAIAGLRLRLSVPMQLSIAGQGRHRSEIEALIGELGLKNTVQLLGMRQDLPALLRAADGLVLSSAWEGMPNVVMEALAAGIPVVATQVGGVSELVQDGESGFIVPPNDPEALANAMQRMMTLSAAERERMGQRGQAHMRTNYGLEHVVDIWETLLLEQLRNKGLVASSGAPSAP